MKHKTLESFSLKVVCNFILVVFVCAVTIGANAQTRKGEQPKTGTSSTGSTGSTTTPAKTKPKSTSSKSKTASSGKTSASKSGSTSSNGDMTTGGTTTITRIPSGGVESERAVYKSSRELGITFQELTPALAAELGVPQTTKGIVVVDINSSSLFNDSDIMEGDIITTINKHPIVYERDIEIGISKATNSFWSFTVNRDGKNFYAAINTQVYGKSGNTITTQTRPSGNSIPQQIPGNDRTDTGSSGITVMKPQDDIWEKEGEMALPDEVLRQMAISIPEPVYPPIAKSSRASGAVEVEITIDSNGNVISAKAISGHALLRTSAEQAARKAKFEKISAQDSKGNPTNIKGILVYNFVLN